MRRPARLSAEASFTHGHARIATGALSDAGDQLMNLATDGVDFNTFSRERVTVAAGSIAIRRAGRGPAVLLLHGYPETSLAWRRVAPALTRDFTVIAADLPGYGDSTISAEAFDDGRISKRRMAQVL